MAFRLKTDESLRKGVRRVVRQQIDRALGELAHSQGDEATHDARKCFKKVRAVLRLVRRDLGPRAYRRESTCFRDAARPLTEARDATVLIEALDEVAKGSAAGVSVKSIGPIRKALLANRVAVHKQLLADGDALRNVCKKVKRARARVRTWDLRKNHRRSVALGGLRRVYRQGYGARAVAIADPTTENLHEWRKQAKYLWHQLQLLERMCPKVIKALARPVHELTELLGDDHDLANLRQRLMADRGATDAVDSDSLFEAIESRRHQLQRRAIALGTRVYRLGPKAFQRQIKRVLDGRVEARKKDRHG